MSTLGKKVLLIDADMQMNLTLQFFDDEQSLEMAKSPKNLYTGIVEQKDLTDFVVPTEYENLDLIPSSTLMSSIEFELFTKWQREFILRQGLTKIMALNKYDYILIDSPPTLGCWVMNIMCASDYLIVPVESSPWGLFGLANMFEFYEQVKQIAPKLELLGIAVTKASERKNYFRQTMETLGELENVRLFENYIRVDSTVEWAQDNSKPVCAYKKSSRAAGEYIKLTEEVLKYAHR
jgi:chromosome partitioning protein